MSLTTARPSAFNSPANETLRNFIHHGKYANYLQDLKRRESYEETTERNLKMHLQKFDPFDISDQIKEAFQGVFNHDLLPSMRSMQFGGPAIMKNPARMYNCSAIKMDHPRAFAEVFFLLLSGCGVGYSVQRHHVAQLPEIRTPGPEMRYLLVDTIEGWSNAVYDLLMAFFNGSPLPRFDASDIRPKGAFLKTSGGRAPGAEPLLLCLDRVLEVLKRKTPGSKLHPIEVHDILCLISEAVLSGGVRRSSYVALFSHDDPDMLKAKHGDWWDHSPWRARANNDACLKRGRHTEKEFWNYWEVIATSGSGEPGIFWTNCYEWLFNPCLEASLRPGTFCNLVTINTANIESQQELNHRARMGARIATLQATYTDFHYLRPFWKQQTEEDALIGVSMTGVMAGNVLNLDLAQAAEIVKEENEKMAKILGINKAKRTTLIKPEGTSSLALGGVPCGIHGSLASGKYIRRITLNKSDSLYKYMMATAPDMMEDSIYNEKEAYACLPMEMPEGVPCQNEEGSIQVLERIRHFHKDWILPGHREGKNTNNVSSTVYVRDWDKVGRWMWSNRESYTAISVLPHDDTVYPQLMYETVEDQRHAELMGQIGKIDLTQVVEEEDNTALAEVMACAGGQCEI